MEPRWVQTGNDREQPSGLCTPGSANLWRLTVRNLPEYYTRELLEQELRSVGFERCRDFYDICLPMSDKNSNAGCFFINMIDEATMMKFAIAFHDRPMGAPAMAGQNAFQRQLSQKTLKVTLSMPDDVLMLRGGEKSDGETMAPPGLSIQEDECQDPTSFKAVIAKVKSPAAWSTPSANVAKAKVKSPTACFTSPKNAMQPSSPVASTSANQPNFCTQCGGKLKQAFKFCPKCGSSVSMSCTKG
jgi:hypothetical protein